MNHEPPTIDMRPDGSFLPPPGRRPMVPWSTKLLLGAIAVAALAVSVAVAALAIWVVSLVLPVAIIAGFAAWLMFKWRRWQLLRGQPLVRPGPFRGFR